MHLIIAEKHIAAKRIASILSQDKLKQIRVSGVDTYEFGSGEERKVFIGLSGHIVKLDFPKAYNNWQKVEAEELIDAQVITTSTQVKIVSALKKLGKETTKATIATDYDREGELIGVEAVDILKSVNPDIEFDRVHYSAITPKEIHDAFGNPSRIDFNLADAGHSRQVIDLVWGASLTRYISLAAGRLGNMFLSVGRVQSPTLALIVEREKERDAFVAKKYWELSASLQTKKGEIFQAEHKTSRFWEKEEVDSILKKLKDTALVSSITTSTKTDKQPTPFNTTEFISAASALGYTASSAMNIAESLYMNGFISYPRTDNTVYPESIDLRAQIEIFAKGPFKEYAEKLLAKKELVPTRGKKETTDHPPIYPASLAKKSELSEQEWKVYELVVRRFFATFAEPAEWETIKARFDISGEEFKANGARLVVPGWRWYYPYNAPEDRLLPVLTEGDQLAVLSKDVAEKETQPPGRYGQGRLIKIMEELGLGTKATRHEIISKLYSRAYIHGNPLQPTKTAFAVVESLEKFAPTISKPDMTSKLEADMDRIAEGEIPEEEVLNESREMLFSVFRDLAENRDNISESLRAGLREDKIIGVCPECGSKLMVMRSKKGGRFIGCEGYPECNFSLPLPRGGKVIVTEKTCDQHDLYHISIINSGKRPWNLGCPQCNFLEWQKVQEEEKKNNNGKIKPKKITDISGIGKVTAEKLTEAGVSDVKDLVSIDPLELSRTTNIPVKKIRSWQDAVA
ncbi:DNA topoisomerase I [Methanolobus chelungpuianus]|uniref:DNA topoisomerase 1 n=1 Tax=Methanolobus chelungpuianus TaxID=502115 RepID=A0AAE3HAV9_9EURY|nr:DNA topoisomerase I [Methanolobus chelungpuianus]MCQ6962383.1 DNA topoisomerase I [Methanolobus chelungpuianus]